jgi:hypothetical protein
MSKKDAKTPVKKEEEDDSTARLAYGYRKRCDSYGFTANLANKVKLEEAIDINRFEIVLIFLFSCIARRRLEPCRSVPLWKWLLTLSTSI